MRGSQYGRHPAPNLMSPLSCNEVKKLVVKFYDHELTVFTIFDLELLT